MSKFKVGDKVKIRKNLNKINHFVGGYNPDMKKWEGKIVTIKALDTSFSGEECYKIDVGDCCFIWDERAFEPLNIKPSKDELFELPIGTKITTDLEEDNVFVKTAEDRFENTEHCMNDYDINNDLTIDDSDYGTKIIKIEIPTYETSYDSSKEVKEMTIAEISEALGYEVKVVKEDK